MTTANIVTIVNQTGRPATYNLAPVSDNAIHLPPNGRLSILEEELSAYEVQGAIGASPPRLAVIRQKPAVQIVTPATTIMARQESTPQPVPMEDTPTSPGKEVAVPVADRVEDPKPAKKPKVKAGKRW